MEKRKNLAVFVENGAVTREDLVARLNNAAIEVFENLYKRNRRSLARRLGAENVQYPILSTEPSTYREKKAIRLNADAPFCEELAMCEDFERKPGDKMKLSILQQGYHVQWFLMRYELMMSVAQQKVLRLLRAFPDFRDAYFIYESLRSDYYECKTEEEMGGYMWLLDHIMLRNNPVYEPFYRYIDTLPVSDGTPSQEIA